MAEEGALSCDDPSCETPSYSGGCRCDGGQPKNFLRPCVLLLLAEQSAHGYELMERLKAFGFPRDPGGLYRVLRSMEREGQVTSHWEPSVVGPSRCLYRLTPVGRDWLGAWADTLDETRRTLEEYQGRFVALATAEAGTTATPAGPARISPRLTLDDVASFKSILRSKEQ